MFRGAFSDQIGGCVPPRRSTPRSLPTGTTYSFAGGGGTGSRDELSLMPFVGGTETVLPLNGSLSDWRWGVEFI